MIACDGPPLTSTSPHQSSRAARSSGKLVYQRGRLPPPLPTPPPPSPFNQARGYNASLALTSDQRRGHGGESGSQSRAHPLRLLFLSVAAGRRDSIKSCVYSAVRLHQGPLRKYTSSSNPRALTKAPYPPSGPRSTPAHPPPSVFFTLPCSSVFFFHDSGMTIITKRPKERKTKKRN